MISRSMPLRRALAVGVLILVVVSVWLLGLQPLYRITAKAVDELDNARFELTRLTRMADEAARAEPDASLETTEALRRDLLSVEGEANSSARLLSAIDPMIRRSGLRLQQMKAVPSTRSGALSRSTLDITASGQEAQVVQLLADIEGHRPLLTVDRLILLSQGGALGNEAPDLSVEIRVSGFAATLGTDSSNELTDAR